MIDWVKVENTQECKRSLKIRHVIQCCKEQNFFMKNHPHRISRVGQLSIQFIFYTYTLRKAFNTINASNDWLEIIQWNLYTLTFLFYSLTMMATKRRFFFLYLLLQMVQAIQVLRFHLLELEKVSDYEMK